MTRDEIIRIANELGILNPPSDEEYQELLCAWDAFCRGYEAGVLTEREACAKLVEPSNEHVRDASWGFLGGKDGVKLLQARAAEIRARKRR